MKKFELPAKMSDSFFGFLLEIALRHFIRQGTPEHRAGFPSIYQPLVARHRQVFHEESPSGLKHYITECVMDAENSYP